MFEKLLHSFSYYRNIINVIKHPDMPPDLIVFVTSRCNARCDYCHFINQIKDQVRKKDELTIEEIELIARNYGPISKLSLCGGEPFLRKDVARIIQAFIDYCGVQIVDIPTNGSLTDSIINQTREVLQRNPLLVLEIQLSIDGPEVVHDTLRQVRGLYKNTLLTFEQLARLRNDHKNLRIKMNLTYQQGNKDAIINMAREFGKKYVFDRFQITYPHGDTVLKNRIDKLSYDKFYALSREIQLDMRMNRRSDIHSILFRSLKIIRDEALLEIVKNGDMGRICHAGERIVVLDDIGNVFPCEPLWQAVGNVRKTEYSVRRVLESEKMHEFKNKYLGANKCHCTWGCVVLDSIISNPRYYPKILYYMVYLVFFGGKGFRCDGRLNNGKRSQTARI